jgi:hypothetical protein
MNKSYSYAKNVTKTTIKTDVAAIAPTLLGVAALTVSN